MFSFRCIGCDTDLRMDELVRIDGVVQEYDGYGGTACRIKDKAICWHEYCYQNYAGAEAVRRFSPSARNQGFGYPRLKFLPGYNESLFVDYIPMLSAAVVNANKNGDRLHRDLQFYLLPSLDGVRLRLRENNAYLRRKELAQSKVGDLFQPNWSKLLLPHNRALLEIAVECQDLILNHLVGSSPYQESVQFLSADQAFEEMMKWARRLWCSHEPDFDHPVWRNIYIFGRQRIGDDQIEGEVFASIDLKCTTDYHAFAGMEAFRINEAKYYGTPPDEELLAYYKAGEE